MWVSDIDRLEHFLSFSSSLYSTQEFQLSGTLIYNVTYREEHRLDQ